MRDEASSDPARIPYLFAEAWNEHDAASIAALFVDDADFVNVVGIWWEDRSAIERAHAYGLDTIFGDSHLRVGRVKVRRLGEDVSVIHARMYLTGQTPIGDVQAPARRSNIFSFVAHRTKDGWRCVSAHNTDVSPGAETNVVDEEGRLHPADYRGSAP